MNSIRLRLLFVSLLILLAFVLITGFALQKANQTSALQAQEDRMQGLVYALMGAIEIDDDNFALNAGEVPEPRLGSPASGLVATVADARGRLVWQSASAIEPGGEQAAAAPGEWRFRVLDDQERFSLAFGFRWLAESGAQLYSIHVSEEMAPFLQRQAQFRRQLWLWLLVPAALLLLVQLVVLAWVMRPLKRLAREVGEIESGEDDRVDGVYPRELHGLQGALNTLLGQERSRQQRYRQALDDLAHSLKTPLAVIRNLVHSGAGSALERDIAEQSERMELIVARQLKRAAVRSQHLLSPPVGLREPLEATLRSMRKIYADKGLALRLEMQGDPQVRVDRADLYELIGNLLDNACKWARSLVEITIAEANALVEIRIRDDGPGFPAEAARLLERGLRADSLREGQGLGLALVNEIVTAAGGGIELVEQGEGACVRLTLPAG
ncbi:MAG: ATP-binding protein [Gammaproteobacteria bacterium]